MPLPVLPFIIPWMKILKFGLPIIGLGLIIWYIYSLGSKNGEANVQAKWNAERSLHKKYAEAEQTKINEQQMVHQQRDKEITNALAKINETQAGNTARIAGEYALRMQDSARREALYRSQAEGTAVERTGLASYAAELDRTLSEGIELVDSFQTTLEVRDGQLRALGAQITNDRQLINGSGQTDADSTTIDHR